MIRETEIDIHGQQVECRYFVNNNEVEYCMIKSDGIWWATDELLRIESVLNALQDDHANKLLEENA